MVPEDVTTAEEIDDAEDYIEPASYAANPLARTPTWFRWILVIPIACASYFVVQLLVGLWSELQDVSDPQQDLWSQAINSVVGPWAFVFAGARIAPPDRAFETALTLTVIYGIVTRAVVAALVMNWDAALSPWWVIASAVAGTATVIVTCIRFRREGEK